jgi:methionine S-methyltransferase
VDQNVVVFPSRAVAIENALRLFSPGLAIVDEHLTRYLPKQWLTSVAKKVHFYLFMSIDLRFETHDSMFLLFCVCHASPFLYATSDLQFSTI